MSLNLATKNQWMSQCVAVCCSVLQCVAVCCSVCHQINSLLKLMYLSPNQLATGWRRPIGCLIFIRHFLQKSPTISGSFAKRNFRMQASFRKRATIFATLYSKETLGCRPLFAKEPRTLGCRPLHHV